MKIQVLMLNQDDPKKCSAAKLSKFGLAKKVNTTTKNTIVLDPYSTKTLIPKDKKLANSITAIDCSWNLADQTFVKNFAGIKRKLPPLLAGNPVNYSKIGKLTTVEALSASLFILGLGEDSMKLLDKFKWGHTFFELNRNLLDEYSKIESEDQISSILKEYQILL